MALTACDPGGRLTQLTPQPPPGTPILLGITAEAPGGGTLATAAPQATDSPFATSLPQPIPTYDPARPAWTILYYAGTDNGRARFVWDDLNEMEAAGSLDQLRVVAQVDWSSSSPAGTEETARYLVAPDEDAAQLSSEVVATLGEVNMGDPATLADFLAWGIATYPANRYALVLGDFGGGWEGCCYDGNVGVGGQADHLSLPDIDQALATAQQQTGARLDVLAFSAGLMSQLDVLQTIQPYAAYAVASAGLVPGSSWDFASVLVQLNADPLMDGRRFAGEMVTSFVNYQRQLGGDEYSGMAAVDLAKVPALSAAVESLALTLGGDPNLYGAIAADGRRGAQPYGAAALTETGRIAAVDLLHAAAIIAETAPAGDLPAAASAVSAAVTASLVAYDHGLGIPAGRGIAIYWPATPEDLDPLYAQITRLPAWATYLGAAASRPVTPQVTVDSSPRTTVNISTPALLRSRLVGERLQEVALVADQEAADGRRVLRQYETIQPAPMTLPGGTAASMWADGQHESLIVWDATAGFVADGSGAGDFAAFQPVDFSSIGPQLALPGTFRFGEGQAGFEATAVFQPEDPALRRMWAVAQPNSGARLIGEVPPAPGDRFQAALIFSGADGRLSAEPGITLTFDSASAIYRTTRALPGGNYAVGLRATAVGQLPVVVMQPLVIDPGPEGQAFRAFVDVERNSQFLYPADWLPPITQNGIAYTANISNTTQLQVRYYPDWSADLPALQAEVLGTFGDVSVLLQESVQVSTETPVEAVRTAYGYDSADQGARTGMFLTFLKDGTGYVVDLDGPREQETSTVAIMDTIAATWQFLSPRLGFGPEPQAVLNVADYRLQYPSDFAYQAYNNWHRFAADPQTFVAVRIQSAGRTPAEAMAGLLQTAAEGVAGFSADEPRRFFYAGHVWERNDFHYTDPAGSLVAGLLLSRQEGSTEIAVWAEGPDPADVLIQTVFLPTAATIERIPAPPSG
ncbi:MAG: hypothetical protein KA586_02255 [Candidatus Promineofilum sp.]|nr:hypothetical protein [Promineifilum sp.]